MAERLVRSYNGEERTVFYRSRFEVRPRKGQSVEVWPQIIRVLQIWLEDKEYGRQSRGRPSLHEAITSDVENYSHHYEATLQECYLNCDFAQGRFDQATPQSHLVSRSFVGAGSEYAPQFWAMEYMEASSGKEDYWYRRWCTNVGVTALPEGGYVVNASVYILDDPSCLVDVPEIPPRNVPNFIAPMLDIEGCVTTANGMELSREPVAIGPGDFDEFIGHLTDPGRSIPLVVISAERDTHEFLLDPRECAVKLRGAAIVYTLDLNDRYLLLRHRQAFREGDPSYGYAIPFGFARVFLPGVNLENREGYRRHRFYSANQLREVDSRLLVNDVCGSITRLSRRRPNEVVDLRGIREQQDLKARADLDAQLTRLREAFENSDMGPEREPNLAQSAEELSRALEEANKKLVSAHENEAFLLEYISSIETSADAGVDNREYEDLKAENSLLQEENDRLERDNQQLQEEKARHASRIASLTDDNDGLRRDIDAARAQRELLEGLEQFPKSPVEALRFARDAFPARLVVLGEAEKSAEEFRGDPSEVWDILRCMACTLWRLAFDEREGPFSQQAFRDQTGYDLAMSESSTTRNDARLLRLRERHYKERTIDISPHVKGTSGPRERPLRVHFYLDHDDKLIVIGHCGAHLDTAGTRYVR